MAPLILIWIGRLKALKKDATMPKFRYELAFGLKFWFSCAICEKEFGPDKLAEVYKFPKEILLDAAKKHLTMCPKCTKWVCVDCWNPRAQSCKVCLG